jgi:hypothetical protein
VNWFKRLFGREEKPVLLTKEEATERVLSLPSISGLPYGIEYQDRFKTEFVFIKPDRSIERLWLLWFNGHYCIASGSATEAEINLTLDTLAESSHYQ